MAGRPSCFLHQDSVDRCRQRTIIVDVEATAVRRAEVLTATHDRRFARSLRFCTHLSDTPIRSASASDALRLRHGIRPHVTVSIVDRRTAPSRATTSPTTMSATSVPAAADANNGWTVDEQHYVTTPQYDCQTCRTSRADVLSRGRPLRAAFDTMKHVIWHADAPAHGKGAPHNDCAEN